MCHPVRNGTTAIHIRAIQPISYHLAIKLSFSYSYNTEIIENLGGILLTYINALYKFIAMSFFRSPLHLPIVQ